LNHLHKGIGSVKTPRTARPFVLGEIQVEKCRRWEVEQIDLGFQHVWSELLEGGDVHDEQAATVGPDDQVRISGMNDQIVYRYGRKLAEPSPSPASVER
jgi:hypothetical protein